MDLETRKTALTIAAAVVSFYTARSVRIDNESSKLLLLTPHNDSVSDLQDTLGLPTQNYPPTLYDFYLACVYKKYLLKDNLACFRRSDRQRQDYTHQNSTKSNLWKFTTGLSPILNFSRNSMILPRLRP